MTASETEREKSSAEPRRHCDATPAGDFCKIFLCTKCSSVTQIPVLVKFLETPSFSDSKSRCYCSRIQNVSWPSWTESLHQWTHYPLQVLKHSWDTEDSSWGETTWLAGSQGEVVPSNRPETNLYLGRDNVCLLTSCFVFQVFFWYKQLCLSYHCSFFFLILWGIVFPEENVQGHSFLIPCICYCWAINVFLLYVYLFPPLLSMRILCT